MLKDQNWLTVAEKNDSYWSARWFSACVRACVRACVCLMQVLLFAYVVWIHCSQYHCHFPLVLSQISGFMFKSDFCIYVRGSRIANGLLLSSSCPIQWESLGWLQLDHAGEGDVIRYLNPVNRGVMSGRNQTVSSELFILKKIQECKNFF